MAQSVKPVRVLGGFDFRLFIIPFLSLVMAAPTFTVPDNPLEDNWDRLWASMRYARVPGVPDFPSQFIIWLVLPAIVFWSFFYVPLLLSRYFTFLQGKGKYLQFLLLLWGASYFLPAVIFLLRSPYGTVCDLYNRHITPQLMYTDAFAVCTYPSESHLTLPLPHTHSTARLTFSLFLRSPPGIMMALHMIIEQADMREGFHATSTLFVATLIPYPIFLFRLTSRTLLRPFLPPTPPPPIL